MPRVEIPSRARASSCGLTPDFASALFPGQTLRDLSHGIRMMDEAKSRDDGTFTFEHVPVEWAYEPHRTGFIALVGVSAEGYANEIEDVVAIDEGAKQTIKLRCNRTARVSGRVKNETGRGLAGMRVSVWRGAREQRLPSFFPNREAEETRTDSAGRYQLSAVPAADGAGETIEIAVFDPSQPSGSEAASSSVKLAPGDVVKDFDIVVKDVSRAYVTVLDSQGKPVSGAQLSEHEKQPGWWRCDADGRAVIEDESERLYRQPARARKVIVRAPGFAAQLSPRSRRRSRIPRRSRSRFEPEHRVRGWVASSNGRPEAGVAIFALNGGIPAERALSEQLERWKDPSRP